MKDITKKSLDKSVGRLQRRSTADIGAFSPTWSTLLDKWEDGGTYIVKPRDPGDVLKPGPGNRVYKQLTKTIPAYQMFYKGMKSSLDDLWNLTITKLSQKYEGKTV